MGPRIGPWQPTKKDQMTHLESEIVDFQLVRSDGVDLLFRFRIAPWKCEDFAYTMEAFKAAIPLAERKPYPDRNWLWEIDGCRRNRTALANLFDNFEACYQTARSQLSLWPD